MNLNEAMGEPIRKPFKNYTTRRKAALFEAQSTLA
jgi:hypothetical protein